MRSIFLLCVVIFLANAIFAIPARKGEKLCTYPDLGDVLPVGQSASVPGKCIKITCQDDLSIGALTCPLANKQGCKNSKIDFSKPYPECCPKLVC